MFHPHWAVGNRTFNRFWYILSLSLSRRQVVRLRTWFFLASKYASSYHGPLARYVKFRVAHTPGMPGVFSPPPQVSDLDMHHGTCVTHVPWCMPGSLTSGFLWSRWQGKCSRHSRRMRNPQFYVSGKRPMEHDKWIIQMNQLKGHTVWECVFQSRSYSNTWNAGRQMSICATLFKIT